MNRATGFHLAVVPGPDDIAALAAARFLALAAAAIAARGRFTVALAGGSTPRAMNALLARGPAGRIDWGRVDFFFGDERCVPPDHADSNYRMTRETLFEPLAIDPARIFRIEAERPPDEAARAYDDLLRRELGADVAVDALFLGMGPDGHTASLFPGTLGTIDPGRAVVANYVAKFGGSRITVTPRTINAARHVTVTAGGEQKAVSLARVIDGPPDPESYPAQLIAPRSGDLTWIVDAAAAAALADPNFHDDDPVTR